MEMMKSPKASVPMEPVLPMDDIQGMALPGFLKPHHLLLGLYAARSEGASGRLRRFLAEMAPFISTATQAHEDRKANRAARLEKVDKVDSAPLIGMALSSSGLQLVTIGSSSIPSPAFQQGLAARSAFLGDPTDPTNDGHPKKWKVGGPQSEIDVLIVIAGDKHEPVKGRGIELISMISGFGLDIRYKEYGDIRPDMPGHEHFGFDDGISQPGIRGRVTDDDNAFLAPRHIAKDQYPEHVLFGYPGQDLVWPGEFVLGLPATSADPLIPGKPTPAVPDWTQFGSFLVFRRLKQDVGLFWRTMRSEAERLRALPGFEKMTDEILASRIVGRWQSGAPVNRVPEADHPDLGRCKLANNNFRFDSDSRAIPLEGGHADSFQQAKADPAGTTCPWAAHIRKVNTRDSASDTGGRDSTYMRRILRTSVPFGAPLKDRYAEISDDPEEGERGLLFLSIQASIEDQFEFLMTRWMGDPSRPKMPAGHDILVGQNGAAGEGGVRRCVIFGAGLQQAAIETKEQWIIPTGGGYFFVPSIKALREVLSSAAKD